MELSSKRVGAVFPNFFRVASFMVYALHPTTFYPSGVFVVAQFYPWFKFYFPLFQTHYHTLPYPETKENKIKPRIRLNHNIYKFNRFKKQVTAS